MSRRLSTALIAIVVLQCASATCLYSGAGPIPPLEGPAASAWHPALAAIADLLTVPLPTRGIADIRDVVQPLFLAILVVALLVASFGRRSNGAPTHHAVVAAEEGPAESLLRRLAVAVAAIALLSAIVGGTFDLSWGWIARFAVGAAWALIIARLFTAAMIRQTLFALSLVGAATLLLAVFHRADRGLAHFAWPIGPITITAALAAVWAAMTLPLALSATVKPQSRPAGAALLIATALSLYALIETGRRAAMMGLTAALTAVAAILIWQRFRQRTMRIAVVAALALVLVAGILYVVRQATSADRLRSGPLQVRFTYWEKSLPLIGQHPLLGIGPDRFVVDMTNAMAPIRAESPQLHHGNFDTAAHNEWLQAAVELGIPGGILYALLPLSVISVALMRTRRDRNRQDDTNGQERPGTYQLALIAGLVAIVVIEAASITLRGPIMPAWYWTLLGLLAATIRTKIASARRSVTAARPAPASSATATVVLLLGALACATMVIGEISASVVRSDRPSSPSCHLYAEKTLDSRYRRAATVDDWQAMFKLMPSYRDTPARYAEALIAADRRDDARDVLDRTIAGGIDPFGVRPNVLYASLLADDPVGQLRCAQRALRSGALDEPLQRLITECLAHPAARRYLAEHIDSARPAADDLPNDALKDATIELLRIAAFDAFNQRRCADAIPDQRRIADAYLRLEQSSHRYRRAHDAETDAFYQLARMIYQCDRADYEEALDAIRQTERLAVLGIAHEKVADPDPDYGYVIGEVIPVEFPERLRPLWALSALLHLVAGDDRFLDFRIFWSLPPKRWTQRNLNAELARLAQQAYDDLSTIPADRRPPHFAQLPDMIRRFGADQPAAPAD